MPKATVTVKPRLFNAVSPHPWFAVESETRYGWRENSIPATLVLVRACHISMPPLFFPLLDRE